MEKHRKALWRPIVIILIIITAFLLSACGGSTPAPPFITVSSGENLKLYVSMTEQSSTQTSLEVQGMGKQTATTLTSIPESVTAGIGDKSDRRGNAYFALSFYIINGSDRAFTYELSVNVTEHTGTVLNALRVMVLAGTATLSEGDIYAKPETSEAGKLALSQNTSYTTQPFVSDSLICRRQPSGLQAGSKIKQTVIVWFEGHDVDCNDSILGQTLTLNLSITAY